MTALPTLTMVAVPQRVARSVPLFFQIAAAMLGFCLWSSSSLSAASVRDVIQREYSEAHSRFVSELQALARQCDSLPLKDLAAELHQASLPFEEIPIPDDLPATVQLDIPMELPEQELALRVRARKLRVEFARQMYLLARRSQKEKFASFAYRLVRETLFHDPDHKEARRLMGFRLVNDKEWLTPFADKMRREGMVWHDRFGWLPQKNVARYEQGERLYNGQWITADREAVIRSNFKNAWEIRTEHFRVRTNHSQEKGVELASHAEKFHRYFMREFAAFFQTPQQLAKLFANGAVTKEGDLHDIDFFRTKQEFVNAIANQCPVAQSIQGFYSSSQRKAYFYNNPATSEETAMETLVHEVTHQLLSESSQNAVAVGHEHDFWVVEGVACYLESFRLGESDSIQVGQFDHPRFVAARHMIVEREVYEPYVRYSAMGMKQFQAGAQSELQDRYAQATGFTYFLMQYQGGIYRDGFIEFLSQLYSPDQRIRERMKPLYDILGVSDRELDEQFVKFMKSADTPETNNAGL